MEICFINVFAQSKSNQNSTNVNVSNSKASAIDHSNNNNSQKSDSKSNNANEKSTTSNSSENQPAATIESNNDQFAKDVKGDNPMGDGESNSTSEENYESIDTYPNNQNSQAENNSSPEETENSSKEVSIWNYLLFGLVLISFILILFLFLQIQKLKRGYDKEFIRNEVKSVIKNSTSIKLYLSQMINASFQNGYKEPKISEREIDLIIDNVMVRIKKDNPQIFDAIKPLTSVPIQNASKENVPIVNTQTSNTEILYCEEARNGDYFNIGIAETKQANSIFYLKLQNPNSAKFGIIQEDRIMKKVFEFDDYMKNSCKVGAISSNARGLTLVKEGLAVKQGEKWEIREKAEYKYI